MVTRVRSVLEVHGILRKILPGWAVELWMFIIVGIIQLTLDSLVFILFTWLGGPLVLANVIGRLAGAGSGYLLNGAITFLEPGSESKLSVGSGSKFVFFWMVSTLISTTALYRLHDMVSIHVVWLIKPVVEGLLAILSFLVAKHWIYR